MRLFGFRLLLVVLGLVLGLGNYSLSLAVEKGAVDLAAKVNGVPITKQNLDLAMNNVVQQRETIGRPVDEAEKETLRKNILDQLIATELIYQASKKEKLGDLKTEIETQFNNVKGGFASEEEFKKALSDRNITVETLKKDIERNAYINTLINKKVFSGVSVSEEETKKEYENNKGAFNVPDQVKASHILIRAEEGATPEQKQEARKKIEALRSRAVSGEDFATLAKENSEDASKINGGDLGYFAKGQMVLPFEEAAFSLNKDEISQVVETQFGYHIIKLLDKSQARTLSYDEVKENLEEFLLNRHRQEALNKYIDELKKTAKIEIF